MANEVKPDNISQGQSVSNVQLKATDPVDFNEGGSEYRRNILISTSLTAVLLSASKLKPEVLGVEVAAKAMWFFLGVAHIYFFIMWRLTSPVENDRDKKFWNLKGLIRQAFLSGTKGFPGKTRAQIIFIRALPLWLFIVGLVGIFYGCIFKG